MTPAAHPAVVAAGAAGTAVAAYRLLRRRPPGGAARWARANYRGRPVTLLAGPAVAAGAVCGAAAAAGSPALVAGAGAAALGLLDDLAGGPRARGLRGHAAALRSGRVTTGSVKLAGIGASALAASALRRRPLLDTALDAAVVAGSANLVNLLDLRPGRALKVTLLAASLLALERGRGRALAVAPAGAALALLGPDLGERAMIGDCGANALGALLGLAAAERSRPARATVLTGIVGLTALSERVSFSAVIERTPALAALDRLGRSAAGGDRG